MNYDYVIRLQRPNYRAINFISQILLLLFVLAFVYYCWLVGWNSNVLMQSLVLLIVVGLWLFNVTRGRGEVVYYRLPLIIAALGWVFLPFGWQWVAVVYALMGILERQIKFPDEIGFTREKVVRNTFPRKTYEWIDIDNVMIRNNLFTLDLRNNKLVQRELETPVNATLQEEFNTYCRQQLHFSLSAGEKS
jgi:hypothetical protein